MIGQEIQHYHPLFPPLNCALAHSRSLLEVISHVMAMTHAEQIRIDFNSCVKHQELPVTHTQEGKISNKPDEKGFA
jgi:hypothetical protein